MKLVLTEQQFREVLIRESVEAFLDESSNLQWWKTGLSTEKLKNLLVAGVAAGSIIASVNVNKFLTSAQRQAIKSFINRENAILHNDREALMRAQYSDSLHQAKVEAVRQCLGDKMKNFRGPKNYDPNEVKVAPDEFVSAAEENNYDLVLVLAQAWCESRFCTTKRAKETNSMFSVGCYDNGKNKCVYKTPGESISPYMNLMKNDYAIDDTLQDIFKGKKGLVNQNGDRYASDVNYEKTLKSVYDSIKKAYPVLSMNVDEYMQGLNLGNM